MNPEPTTTVLTSQRPCSRRASDQAEGIPRLSAQLTSWNAPPLPPSPNEAIRDLDIAAEASQQLKEAHGVLGGPGEGVIQASVNINAGYHLGSDQTDAITNKSPDTSQLKAGGDPTISPLNTRISLHARDVQSAHDSGLSSSFEPLRRPSVPDVPSSAHTLKHPRSQILSELPLKKRRPGLKRRHTLGPESFPEGFASLLELPSLPLTSPAAPQQGLPPRPSTAHAIAAIRNKVREDSGGITTLKLARGNIGNGSAQRSTNMLGNLVSMEDKANTPLDPETRSTQIGLEVLGNVGIVELLEQDERPTFIIDVANPANYTPGGPLQIVFANASLRAHEVRFSGYSTWPSFLNIMSMSLILLAVDIGGHNEHC